MIINEISDLKPGQYFKEQSIKTDCWVMTGIIRLSDFLIKDEHLMEDSNYLKMDFELVLHKSGVKDANIIKDLESQMHRIFVNLINDETVIYELSSYISKGISSNQMRVFNFNELSIQKSISAKEGGGGI